MINVTQDQGETERQVLAYAVFADLKRQEQEQQLGIAAQWAALSTLVSGSGTLDVIQVAAVERQHLLAKVTSPTTSPWRVEFPSHISANSFGVYLFYGVVGGPPWLTALGSQAASASGDDIESVISRVRELVEKEQMSQAQALLNSLPSVQAEDPRVVEIKRVLAPPKVTVVQRTDHNRADEYQWLEEHSREYRGNWVALDGYQLVGSARTLAQLLRQLGVQREQRSPLIHRIP
jgi:hypothetical protein